MSVNSVSRYNSYRVHPVSHSDGSPTRDDRYPRHTPLKEYKTERQLTNSENKVTQPSMVGVFLDRWA